MGARGVLDEMLSRGVRPTVVTFNTLVGSACREGELGAAERLIDEMVRRGVAPNAATYSLLMQGLCDADRHADAEKLMFDMEYRGCQAEVVNYGVLMSSRARRGDVDGVRELFSAMCKRKLKPDDASYNVLIKCPCDASRVDEAHRALLDMQLKGTVPGAANVPRPGRRVLQGSRLRAGSTGFQRDVGERTLHLVRGLGEDGKVEEACFVLEQMKRREMSLDADGWQAVVTCVRSSRSTQASEIKLYLFYQQPAAQLGHGGCINVLFETPSGFAIFAYDGIKLLKPNAMQDIWADFVSEYVAKRAVALKEFKTFEDKLAAINHETGVSEALASMIQKYTAPLQKLPVGNDNYRDIIEKRLHIPCMSGPHVDELMWGLKIQMRARRNSELIKEDRFPMSVGMTFLLNRHKFVVHPDMLVIKLIIEKAGVMFECDRCVNQHNDPLRSAAEHIKKISRIDTQSWDLMKVAAAFKLFTRLQLEWFRDDAPKYKDKILKVSWLIDYNEIYRARELRLKTARVLFCLVKWAKEAYEAEQAGEATSDHEIGPDGKEIHPGITPVIIDELTECVCDIILSARRKERQVCFVCSI
uniref:Uncharacterized protein n=1 Tax=Oryza barthii TaxID=65489 RepID=A0A0D3FJI7_9ORYZ